MRYALRPIAVGYAGTQCPMGEQTAARILTMPCPEKIRLIEEYTAATSELYIAVTVVRSSSGVELMEAKQVSQAARSKCEQARHALQSHKSEHGC